LNAGIDPLQALLLGVIQGLTEFLPVSSSGHLVIFHQILGMKEPDIFFDVCLHVGTLAAVCLFVRKELAWLILSLARAFRSPGSFRKGIGGQDPDLRLLILLAVATLATAVVAIVFMDFFKGMFGSPKSVGTALIVTGAVLSATVFSGPGASGIAQVRLWQALIVGMGQGVAVAPGISRSGATISLALMLGMEREFAARFSFLLFIPAIVGALILEFDISRIGGEPFPLLLGTTAAGVTGFLALRLLLGVVKKGRLWIFAPYCFLLGIRILTWTW